MGRLYYLDNLRSFALLLGVFFHAAIVYADSIHYAVQNEERSVLLSYFCYWVHSFRMPMFFMISGFFSALVWEKKGKLNYTEGRIKRILIPMVIGLIFLAPIQYYLMERIKYPGLDVFEFLNRFFSERFFQHSHIWFLVDLFLFSCAFIISPKWLFGSRSTAWIQNNFLFKIVLILFCFFIVLAAHTQFPKGMSVWGIAKLTFWFQFAFFFTGVFSYHRKIYFQIQNQFNSLKTLALGIWAIVFLVIFKGLEISDPMWMYLGAVPFYLRTFHIFLWVLLPFLWTSLLVSIFAKFYNTMTNRGKYLIEASLPIYLLHHPISLIFAFFIQMVDCHIAIKFVLHVFVVFFISFFIYHFLIRPFRPMRFVFGIK
ncbi:acyltransferase family protein [Leptospira sp. 96542]|nr:acyltransferase family protein [Leptospira sp. 96542]